jgi:diaminohydroxyphosphoribosylaminopyrimidine deaminase/5-amino-6-(5-phosphoribosylamino)uracil reductase
MTDRDDRFMRRALELAARGRGSASPNPMVGCVIARGDDVAGEGHHVAPGEPHAEVVAIAAAGSRARGATLYVNLEPCNHTGRTGPCAPAVLEAGIARVVYGASDPIAGHRGGGRWLRRQGVEVSRGVLEPECRELNRVFFHWARTGRPYAVLKVAASLDGKAAMASGESQWITSKAARAHGRELRAELDAICVGVGTVLADDPRLTTRRRGARDPLRVIVDSRLRTPPDARALPAIIATSERAPRTRERRLLTAGAEVWRLGEREVDLAALLDRLGGRSIAGVVIEGGPTLQASFAAGGLAQELRLYLAPLVLGGSARSWLGDTGAIALADASALEIERIERVGRDVLLTARFR